jgi:ABC-type multidrug transport system ATPase subunit
MTVQAAIEARAVTYRTRTGGVTVRDVSLTVGQGELVAIIGGSGSGKTTLLDALSGLLAPTSGTVFRYPEGQIGYVPAGDSLHPVLPLAEALRYAAVLRGVRDPGGATGQALAAVGLAAEASRCVGALNPGERKRAEIAAELLADPAALFLDEPMAALDPAQSAQVLRLLRDLSANGCTVLLTTTSALDAARCDKVAVLATGGHLAFFGTPAAARGYFGADSLEEIYERLAGLGDPATAWSRRFFYLSRTAAGATPVPTTPRAPGPALLIPDQAGPHSAGRPSVLVTHDLNVDDLDPEDWSARGSGPGPGLNLEYQHRLAARAGGAAGPENGYAPDEALPAVTGLGPLTHRPAAGAAVPLGPARQLPVLIRRNVKVLARAPRQQAILAAAPLVVLLVFGALLGVGALDGPAAVTLAWAVLGGLATGLAYELPARAPESGVLRRERCTGVSVRAFLAAKAAVLLPLLAVADLLILAVPGMADRLQAGFGLSYLEVFVAALIGLTVATATLFPWSQQLVRGIRPARRGRRSR